MNLTEMVEIAGRHAHRVLVEHKERMLTPSFCYETKDGNITFVATPWHSRAEKKVMVDIVRRKMREEGAAKYAFVTEGWVSDNPNDPRAPSDQPDHWEMVLACATDGVTQEVRTWEIKRDRRHRITALVPNRNLGGESFKSWLFDLLGEGDEETA